MKKGGVMEFYDLKGNIFFEKDDKDGNLSELLYDPILKIFNLEDNDDFNSGLSSIMFLMTWDNIIIKKNLRIEFFQFLSNLIFYGNGNCRMMGFSFFQAIVLSCNLKNSFGIKNFIDLNNKKILHWEEVFKEAGVEAGFII